MTLWLGLDAEQLNVATLVGIPRLSPIEQRRGKLLQEGVYGIVRHPRYVIAGIGVMASVLFVNHLGLYLVMALVVPAGLVMVVFEERELVSRFGDDYRLYQRAVPRFIPRWRGRPASVVAGLISRQRLDDDARRRSSAARKFAAKHCNHLADDLGYGDLGAFGSPNIKTPRLDAMAAKDKWTSFYVQRSALGRGAAHGAAADPQRDVWFVGGTRQGFGTAPHRDFSQGITIAEV